MSPPVALSLLRPPSAPTLPPPLPRRPGLPTTTCSLRSPSSPRAKIRRLFSVTALPVVWKGGDAGARSAPPLHVRCAALPPLSEIAPAAAASYGTLLLGGGLFAYARSGSKGSILGGLTGAALMAATYYLMQNAETKAAGDALGFGSATLFSATFGIRLAATRKLIPSGLLLGFSAGSLAVFVSAYVQDKI